jgi:hypothetical protein
MNYLALPCPEDSDHNRGVFGSTHLLAKRSELVNLGKPAASAEAVEPLIASIARLCCRAPITPDLANRT